MRECQRWGSHFVELPDDLLRLLRPARRERDEQDPERAPGGEADPGEQQDPRLPDPDRAHENPHGQDDAVEQPLREQRAGGHEGRDAVVLADGLDAKQVAAAGRQDVVGGRSDAVDREQPLGRGLVAGG